MKALIAILIAASFALGGYLLGQRSAGQEHGAAAPAPTPSAERKVLYYHDPMFPQQKFDKPGKSPFMDMQLVPVYADSGAESGPGIAVSAGSVQNLGVRTVAAELGTLAPRLDAVGVVAWNERGVVLVQTRAAGFVEKLHARAPLDPVAKGAPLVEILFPDWAAAQEEFLLLLRQGEAGLARAARGRLALLGMSEAEIRDLEQAGAVRARMTLYSPISGIVAELGVREGMTVGAGAALFRLVDLSTVWVNAEVPEAQAAALRPGAAAEARVPGWPEQVFKGRLGAILPDVSTVTRTLRVRLELANPGQRLKPGMFASVSIVPAAGTESVLVPSEAVIRTGERDVVIVAEGGRFVAANVDVGRESGGRSEIRRGLKPGDQIVASGQFLIDSEASLKGALTRLEGAAKPAATDALHPGSGRVLGVDPAKGRIELDHGPMPSIRWPAMSMGFLVADPKALAGIGKGDTVEFEMRGEPDKEGDYVIERLKKKAAK